MTHYEFLLAAQLMAEERLGTRVRQQERAEHGQWVDRRRRLLGHVGG